MTDNNALAQDLEACPDVMHARLQSISQRETEYLLPASLKFKLLAALRTPAPASGDIAGLVERLRGHECANCGHQGVIADEAADMLERLAGQTVDGSEVASGCYQPTLVPEGDHQPTQQPGVEQVERVARAIHEADPDVGVSWDDWVEYATQHPDHMQSIEHVRRSARAAIAAMQPADGGPDFESAWREMHEHLSWMQGSKALNFYLGWNLAAIANDLIDRAYPGLREGKSALPIDGEG